VEQPEEDKENQSESKEVENVEDLKKALAEEKTRCESNLIGWQRAQADFINYKRFVEQDKIETCKYANINLLATILPMIDDFDRAVASIPADQSNNKWVEGLKLIDRKLRDTLQKQGVTVILALGMEFDPHTMEALSSGKGQKDIVVQELEKGYMLNDKVIRPAKVIVGNGEEEAKKEE
jgi:molecular chaperone GrpE